MFPPMPPFSPLTVPHGCTLYYGGISGHAMPAPPAVGLTVTKVTAANLETELRVIAILLRRYPIIVIDTEYPGTVHRPPPRRRESDLSHGERYALVKANVDELPIVQLGITLCDAEGKLPLAMDAYGRTVEPIWEFTFSDFDMRHGRYAQESVAFLVSQGVDFDGARRDGVSSAVFATKFAAVVAPTRVRGDLTWVAFGGAYDFAYLVKMLSGSQPLPETLHEFMVWTRNLLGGRLFDAKYMAEHSGRADLCIGGLRRMASRLGTPVLDQEPPCLAGPKSHTTCRVYTAIRRHFTDQRRRMALQEL
ncbi:hypothetical protein HU200_054094 [Digitaria exilis]|uniref:poly(A)-specific ribonuclease n=1 Tax=Digitaria exilis TaxID=1010633 RepID=A0A835AM26_9POAL|nr:hypothetical protein HU200_054094 [Digitaria exilis]